MTKERTISCLGLSFSLQTMQMPNPFSFVTILDYVILDIKILCAHAIALFTTFSLHRVDNFF